MTRREFCSSVLRAYKKYAVFSGRATPVEFTSFFTFYIVCIFIFSFANDALGLWGADGYIDNLILGFQDDASGFLGVDRDVDRHIIDRWLTFALGWYFPFITPSDEFDEGIGIAFLSLLFTMISFIPLVAVWVRRLHDTNRTGWWLLMNLIPIIGLFFAIILAYRKGDKGENRFGPNPKKA